MNSFGSKLRFTCTTHYDTSWVFFFLVVVVVVSAVVTIWLEGVNSLICVFLR